MGDYDQITKETVPEVPVLALCAQNISQGDSFSELLTNLTHSNSMISISIL